eukprot:scaffold158_cov141-Amphora_coffeaeformis.AAC.2
MRVSEPFSFFKGCGGEWRLISLSLRPAASNCALLLLGSGFGSHLDAHKMILLMTPNHGLPL